MGGRRAAGPSPPDDRGCGAGPGHQGAALLSPPRCWPAEPAPPLAHERLPSVLGQLSRAASILFPACVPRLALLTFAPLTWCHLYLVTLLWTPSSVPGLSSSCAALRMGTCLRPEPPLVAPSGPALFCPRASCSRAPSVSCLPLPPVLPRGSIFPVPGGHARCVSLTCRACQNRLPAPGPLHSTPTALPEGGSCAGPGSLAGLCILESNLNRTELKTSLGTC